MSNFLRRLRRQVSENRETQAVAPRAEFQDAVAEFRKATGKPETRTIPCRCAVTGGAFDIVFERFSPADRFQIARIEQDDAANNRGTAGGWWSGRKPQLKSYDAAEFDWTGCACPHCGKRAGFVYCSGCCETVCAGRVLPLPDGNKAFACHDGCGATGTIGPASHVRGGAAQSRAAMGNWPQLPGRSAPAKALPGRSPPLPGPSRR